jgi:glutamine synthetase
MATEERARNAAPLGVEELRAAVAEGTVDTVLLALTDVQGRLQGKRLDARHFLEDVLDHGAEACTYLLATDVEMNTVGGFELTSWERGYGDFEMVPDLDTLRLLPWQPGTALCLADVRWGDGRDVAPSPRQVLRAQIARLAERGLSAVGATELEFLVFRDSYEEASEKDFTNLRPANTYNVDYSVLGTARVEPLIRRIRREMTGAGLRVESSKGECNLGQHEINFAYGPVLRTADEHAVYKTGAKEIAAQEGMAITFMAKYDEREGSSCHVHLSLRRDDGSALFEDDHTAFERFVAGQLACLRELVLLHAPNVNSYKRFAAESFAPTAVAWGRDNRTCSVRVVGHGPATRCELRLPGADVNPYLTLSALIAAGLHGMDAELELEPPVDGNAYASGRPRVPDTLQEARELFAASAVAQEAFGDEVVGHLVNQADVELRAFGSAVTDWERRRGFERL